MSDFGEVVFSSVNSQSVDVADQDYGEVEMSAPRNTNTSEMSHSPSPHHSAHGPEAGSQKESDYEYQQDEFEGEPGVSSVFGASFNFINSIVGAGIIAIPSAIQQCGLVLGVLLLLMVAYLVNCSVLMLIDCGLKNGKYDLEELAEHLLGRRGYYFTLVFMFLFGYGAQVAYLVVLGDTVPRAAQLLVPGTFFCSRTNTLLLLCTLFVLPLSSFRKLSTLAWTSMVSIAGDVVVVLIVLGACVTLSNSQDEHFEVSDIDEVNNSLFAGISTMGFAFVCQHNSFMVFRSLAKPTKAEWRKVAGLSVSFAWFVCTAFGLIGFFTFFPYVQGDLLNNFPVNSVWIACARLFLAFTMVLTYPMECYVTRHCVLSIITKVYDDRRERLGIDSVSTDDSVCGRVSSTISDVFSSYTTRLSGFVSTTSNEMRSPSNRHEGKSYTNVQDDGEDVTIMFVENKVLMMYDVSIDDTEEASGGGVDPIHSKGANASSSDSGDITTHPTNPLHTSPYVTNATKSTNTNNASTHNLITNNPHTNATTTPNPNTSTTTNTTDARRRRSSADSNVTLTSNNSNNTTTSNSHLPATDRASWALHMGMTLLLWGSTLGIALVFKELGPVAALTGAVAASMLGFVLPAVLYLKTHEVEVRSAYSIAHVVYHGDGTHVNGSAGVRDGSNVNVSNGVVNPLAQHDAKSGDTEVTIEFNRIDDTEDLPHTNHHTHRTNSAHNTHHPHLRNAPHTYLCNPIQHTKLWGMIEPFRKFWLAFFMIVFGLICLVIGVITVFIDNT